MLLFRPANPAARAPLPAGHWWAQCELPSCQAGGPVDLRTWFGGGEGDPPLASLENRLRCPCGARRARLTALPPPGAAASGRAPWLFV